MMHWLLKHDGYPPAITVSLVLHVALLTVIFLLSRSPEHKIQVVQPLTIQATTTKENPQSKRKLERIEQQRRQEQQRKQAEELEKRKVEEERVQKELLVKQEAEKKLQDQKKQQQQAQDQKRKQEEEQKRLAAAREQELKKQKEKQQEDARLKAERELEVARQQQAIQQALTEEQQLIAQYMAYMKELVTQEWNRPPSAKNGMTAVVRMTLVPTGEIISSRIVQTSGDLMFDNSVLQAVKKVQRFPDLQKLSSTNPPVFDKNFRDVALVFTPEDLLR